MGWAYEFVVSSRKEKNASVFLFNNEINDFQLVDAHLSLLLDILVNNAEHTWKEAWNDRLAETRSSIFNILST